MHEVTREQIIGCLKQVGITEGDGLLIHSALQFLGHSSNGARIYLGAIQEVIGKSGTIVVPTFNFDFAQTHIYDPAETPSKGMGIFSEFIRQLPEARRTLHPMQSIASIGRYSDDLTSRDTQSAFDPGSAFERMLELNFKLLLLGADARATSMYHYSEQRANVPYRYWKDFPGQVKTSRGWENRTYRMFVRDLEIEPQLTVDPVVKFLVSYKQWHVAPLNYGKVISCQLTDFVAAVDYFLRSDPWSLVINHHQEVSK